MAQVPLQNCEICEQNDGRRYCLDCEQSFCTTCEQFHLKSKSCRDHIFQDIGQINPEEKKVKCEEHKENMTYYCITCAMLVCKICLPSNHTKHDFSLTNEAAIKLKTDIKLEAEHVMNIVECIEQQKAKLEVETDQFKCLNESIVQNITKKGNDLKNLVDKIINDNVVNVKKEEQKMLQKKTEEECCLKDAYERGKSALLKVANAVQNQGDSMFLHSHQSLLQTIRSIPVHTKSDMEWSAVSFNEGSINEILLSQMIGSLMILSDR